MSEYTGCSGTGVGDWLHVCPAVPGRGQDSRHPILSAVATQQKMVHPLKGNTPLKKMNENGFRNDATADTLQIWKWTEIWIACNPAALTNRDPHGFDLPGAARLRTCGNAVPTVCL